MCPISVPPVIVHNGFTCALLVHDMDQIYNMWLAQNAHSRQSDEAALSKGTAEEKKTAMPTDYAESLVCMLFFPHQRTSALTQNQISPTQICKYVFHQQLICETRCKSVIYSLSVGRISALHVDLGCRFVDFGYEN